MLCASSMLTVLIALAATAVAGAISPEVQQQLEGLAAARRECIAYLEGYEFTSRPDAYSELGLSVYKGCLEELRGRATRSRRTFVGGVHYPTMVTRHPGSPPVLARELEAIAICDAQEPGYRERCCAKSVDGPNLAADSTPPQQPCWGGDATKEVRCCGPSPGPSFIFVTPALDVNVGSRMRSQGTFVAQQSYALQSLVGPGDVVVDAGANIGAYTVPLAAQVGSNGIVYAFEPFRKLFQVLCANVAVNGLGNVHTFQVALGASPERLKIRQPDLSTFNLPSSMQVRNQGFSQVERNWTLFYEGNHMEEVEIRTLDSFELTTLTLLKVDVEDMELEVILGAQDTLRRLRPWVWAENAQLFEAGDRSFVEAMSSFGYNCEPVAGMDWEILCGFQQA